MATQVTQERIISNSAITPAPAVRQSEVQPEQKEIPAVFQEALEAPQVSNGFWAKMFRWAEEYAEYKLTTGYWTQFRI